MTPPNTSSHFQLRAATEVDAPLMAAVEAFGSETAWPESRIHRELLEQTSRSWIVVGNEPLAYVLTRSVKDETAEDMDLGECSWRLC